LFLFIFYSVSANSRRYRASLQINHPGWPWTSPPID